MKKVLLVLAVMVAFAVLPAISMASGTATVTVSATVVGTCKFNSGGTVSFSLDPSVGGNVAGTVTQPQFWCTKNANYTITDDDGLYESGTTHQMKHSTLMEYIPYSFSYTTTGSGLGKNNPITMDISSSVAEADYIDASAGSYSDTVTLTVNP